MKLFTPKRYRWLQRLTGVHRIHHIRWSFGWKLPFTTFAYFPMFTVKHRFEPSTTHYYGWKRVEPKHYHDCTKTGTY